MAPTTAYSESIASTSPAPFSPFSPALSVASESTFVSDENADLGAFQSVFQALSQLHLHHAHHQGQQSTPGSMATSTPSNHPMSPLSLSTFASPPPTSSFETTGFRTSEYLEPPFLPTIRPVSVESTNSASSAAEDGDEESAGVTGSPQSSDSTEEDDIPEVIDHINANLPGRSLAVGQDASTPGHWMYSEISPYQPTTFNDGDSTSGVSSPSAQAAFVLDLDRTGEDESPSLGDLAAAFAFFASERAKLASNVPPAPSPAISATPINKGKGANKQKQKKADKRAKASTTSASDEVVNTETVAETIVGGIQTSSEDAFDMRKKTRRGILIRPPPSSSKSFTISHTSVASSGAATPRNNHGQHRHSRSLPSSQVNLQLPPVSGSQVERLQALARRLTYTFPKNAASLRRVARNPVKSLGIGTSAAPPDDDLVSGGFFDPDGSVNDTVDSQLYVFIDHSNILVGFLEWLKRQSLSSRQARPKLSHAALALILERGRRCARKILVASSPLYQSLDEIASMSYQISVLQRVEIKEGGSSTPTTGGGPWHRRSSSFGNNSNPPSSYSGTNSRTSSRAAKFNKASGKSAADDTVSGSTESDSAAPNPRGALPGRGTPLNRELYNPNENSTMSATNLQAGTSAASRPRYREEAVDELLQLKLLQTLLDSPSPPPAGSTIVLASGDAARSQFNPQGFLGCVKKALERGWKVEVVGWEEGRSRAWTDLKGEFDQTAKEKSGFEIISLDKWGMDLLEATTDNTT